MASPARRRRRALPCPGGREERLLGLHAGWMGEEQTLLGTASGGVFGSLAGQAVFTGIEANAEFGPWRLGATAEIGSVSAQPRGGLVREISPLATSAFALHANRSGRGWQRMAVVPLAAAPRRKRARASGCSHGPNESRERGSQRPVRRSRAKRTADRPGASMVAAAQSRGSSRGGHPVPPAGPSQERGPGVDASLGLATLVLNSPRAPAPPTGTEQAFSLVVGRLRQNCRTKLSSARFRL